MVRVRVPASSANIGSGFDCMGIALSLYNTIELEEIESGILIQNKNSREYIPGGESNLIYRAAKRVFDEVGYSYSGLHITQQSEIPMTRGLGSSSACIIGGMLAANVISGRNLTYPQILDLATDMEGHPDNVTPAIYGGFCTAVRDKGHTIHHSVKTKNNIAVAVMIPDFYVSTKKSRTALPDCIAHSDAAFNVGRAALLALSLAEGRLENLRVAVEDKLHQPYRSEYIENMRQTFDEAYKNGAYAVWLSGSGPTIAAIIDRKNKSFVANMNSYFRMNEHDRKCRRLIIDNVGAIVSSF